MGKKRNLDAGTRVTTNDGRIGLVVKYCNINSVLVNVTDPNGLWPFPIIVEYARKNLNCIAEQYEYEEAPF
jgi:hypothetical protein